MCVRKLGLLAVAGALCFHVSAAQAATVQVFKEFSSIFGTNGHSGVKIKETTIRPSGINVQAGGFALKADFDGDGTKEPFLAWCLDIATYLSLPAYYTVTTSPYTNLSISAAQKSKIASLFATAFPTINLTDNAQSAGFQLALWEIAYEHSGSLNLSNGNFTAYNSALAISAGQGFLNNLGGPAPRPYRLTFLESTPHVSQNLVTASPVPVPPALLLLASALGGLSLLRRRRRKVTA